MKSCIIFLLLFPAGSSHVWCQGFFSVEVDSLTRSYYVIDRPGEEGLPRPLIVLLLDRNTLSTTVARLTDAKIRRPCVMVLPLSLMNRWSCLTGPTAFEADEVFLLRLIFELQNTFHTDPARTFIIGSGNAFCLADLFMRKNPALIRAAVQWNKSLYASGTNIE